jgi:hypothetical protein
MIQVPEFVGFEYLHKLDLLNILDPKIKNPNLFPDKKLFEYYVGTQTFQSLDFWVRAIQLVIT